MPQSALPKPPGLSPLPLTMPTGTPPPSPPPKRHRPRAAVSPLTPLTPTGSPRLSLPPPPDAPSTAACPPLHPSAVAGAAANADDDDIEMVTGSASGLAIGDDHVDFDIASTSLCRTPTPTRRVTGASTGRRRTETLVAASGSVFKDDDGIDLLTAVRHSSAGSTSSLSPVRSPPPAPLRRRRTISKRPRLRPRCLAAEFDAAEAAAPTTTTTTTAVSVAAGNSSSAALAERIRPRSPTATGLALRSLCEAVAADRRAAFRRRWNFDLDNGPVDGPWVWQLVE